jgi:D-glycero-alpha-D-manno-heptose-7-phosphate kinase
MRTDFLDKLDGRQVEASAPCRLDMGGTLDLSTFYLALRAQEPCTFNLALDMRTHVTIKPGHAGLTEVQSKGFEPAIFPLSQAPFDHPLGLMFAIANYFKAEGVAISIASQSPPRSALGGSSSAAVALIAAFQAALSNEVSRSSLVQSSIALAYALEASVAGVPCGRQDHLAAAHGGVHAWYWGVDPEKPSDYQRVNLIKTNDYKAFESHILIAYCGQPHISKDVNSRWVKQFVAGNHRRGWIEICSLTHKFIDAVSRFDYREAAECMNREVAIRRQMTPDVFDEIGEQLRTAAQENSCGARFTGAGGGGCVWALGELEDIDRVRGMWENIVRQRTGAMLLDARIDNQGVLVSIDKP